MFAIFIVSYHCMLGGFCSDKTEPMPMAVCIERAKDFNKNRSLVTSYAYCVEIPEKKNDQ